MNFKGLILFLPILLVLNLACSQLKLLEKEIISEENKLPQSPELGNMETQEPENISPPRLLLWMEGEAFESLALLGFVQELEANSLKITAVVGRGFACWIAMNWAKEGSGLAAEWPVMKWNDNEFLLKSFWKRLIEFRTKALFKNYFNRVFTSTQSENLKQAMLCPSDDFTSSDTEPLPLNEQMWKQLNYPYGEIYSFRNVENYWSEILKGQKVLWLLLKTKESLLQTNEHPQNVIDVSLGNYIEGKSIHNPDNRRFFLNAGKRAAKDFLKKEASTKILKKKHDKN